MKFLGNFFKTLIMVTTATAFLCGFITCTGQEVNTESYRVSKSAAKSVSKSQEQNWGFAFTLAGGHGNFGEKLRDTYKGYLLLGIATDIYYKKLVLELNYYFGLGTTRKDIFYDTMLWEKKNLFEISRFKTSVGYAITNDENIKFQPFAGVAFMSIGTPDVIFHLLDKEAPDWAGIKFTRMNYYTAGINFDLKGEYGEKGDFLSIRLSYSYDIPISKFARWDGYGNMHCFTIGIKYSGDNR